MWTLHGLCGILISLYGITKVNGYGNGLFLDTCKTMMPEHKRNGELISPQEGPRPFQLLFQHDNEDVIVSLISNSSSTFQGFMLEARLSDDSLFGHFTRIDSQVRILMCRDTPGFAVSQVNSGQKTSVQVKWTPQGGMNAEQNVTFRVTYAETFSKFWVGEDFPLLPHTTTTATASTSEVSSPPATSTSEVTSPPATSTSEVTSPPATSTNAVSNATVSTTELNSTPDQITSPTADTTNTLIPAVTSPQTTSDTTGPRNGSDYVQEAMLALMEFIIPFETAKLGLHVIAVLINTKSPAPCKVKTASNICSVFSLLCGTAALVLLIVWDSTKVVFIALVCSLMFLKVIELVLICLPIGPSHELKDFCDVVFTVCSALHLIFTIVVIFWAPWLIDDSKQPCDKTWFFVMTAYAVWILLVIVWTFILITKRNSIQKRNKVSSKRVAGTKQQKIKKKHTEVTIMVTYLISFIGSTAFAVYLTYVIIV